MNRLAGIILVVISAAAFGTLGILGRYAYADGMDALTIMALRSRWRRYCCWRCSPPGGNRCRGVGICSC